MSIHSNIINLSESLGLFANVYLDLMMGDPESYYDWKERFKQKKAQKKAMKKNSLGIDLYQFLDFLEQWKKKNLPLKEKPE